MSERRLGFAGMGVMGGPMAGHLLRAGNSVAIYNRTKSKTEPLIALGAQAMELEELAQSCDVIFICVGRTEDVEECLDGMKSAPAGTLFVDHSTIEPLGAKKLHAKLASRNHRFVDAPITGGSVGAQKGQLTIFLGGSEADAKEVIEIVKPYTKRAERVGGPGAGQMAKMVNQIAVGGALLAFAESMSFAAKSGLDMKQIWSLVSGGAGGSFTFDFYGPKVLARDWTPGFTVDNQRKDLDYCKRTANAIGAVVPGVDLVDSLLARLQEDGHGDWTTAALFEVFQELKP